MTSAVLSVSPYFEGTFRPLHVGDTFTARAGLLSVEFRVEEIRVSGGGGNEEGDGEEAQFCVVNDETVIDCEGMYECASWVGVAVCVRCALRFDILSFNCLCFCFLCLLCRLDRTCVCVCVCIVEGVDCCRGGGGANIALVCVWLQNVSFIVSSHQRCASPPPFFVFLSLDGWVRCRIITVQYASTHLTLMSQAPACSIIHTMMYL